MYLRGIINYLGAVQNHPPLFSTMNDTSLRVRFASMLDHKFMDTDHEHCFQIRAQRAHNETHHDSTDFRNKVQHAKLKRW